MARNEYEAHAALAAQAAKHAATRVNRLTVRATKRAAVQPVNSLAARLRGIFGV